MADMSDVARQGEPQQHAVDLAAYGVKTYRYLRLSIVVVVLALFASVLIERVQATCWEGAISTYYFTPVHSMFVGALVAIGISLVAIRGSTDLEDMLLNVAGVLAPVVAFVPTSPPSDSCASTTIVIRDTKPFINNNVLAYLIAGLIAIAIGYLTARAKHSGDPDRPMVIGLAVAAILLGLGVIWYFAFRSSFLDHAHAGAAAAMFAIVFVVMVLNAWTARGIYRWLYLLGAGGMALSFVVVMLVKLADGGWNHYILWLETLELVFFAIYWTAQTIEHWDGGVPTGLERARRSVGMPGRRLWASVPPR
jgi:hypothetical protein